MNLLHGRNVKRQRNQRSRRLPGFTLIEVLVSMVILAGMMLIITSVIGAAQKSWRSASARVSQFREARQAFDTVTRGLRQATISPYVDYFYSGGAKAPSNVTEAPSGLKLWADLGIKFDRATTIFQGGGSSEMMPGHAVIFQAPLGKTHNPDLERLNNLLCARGFFVKFGSDAEYLPAGLASRLDAKYRYRLFDYQPVTENNGVYGPNNQEWTSVNLGNVANDLRPVAENIVLLAFAAVFPSANTTSSASYIPDLTAKENSQDIKYVYNSYQEPMIERQHHLPRSVQVVMVALDEESASRLAEQSGGGNAAPNPVGASGATFTQESNLMADLQRLAKYFQEKKLNYRIFTSSVLIQAANT